MISKRTKKNSKKLIHSAKKRKDRVVLEYKKLWIEGNEIGKINLIECQPFTIYDEALKSTTQISEFHTQSK